MKEHSDKASNQIEKMYSIPEAKKILGLEGLVSDQNIRQLLKEGSIDGKRIGRKFMVTLRDLKSWWELAFTAKDENISFTKNMHIDKKNISKDVLKEIYG